MPAVACPECQYPNDCDFRFCQRCGYARRTRDQPPSAKLPLVDWDAIEARRQQLLGQRASSQYEKQKSQLEKELFGFLATAPNCRDVMSATPDDVIGFLIWKDRAGKTVVHDADCPGIPGASGCPCPRRLAAGTVDSLIGKLRAVFERSGRAGVWEDKLGMGNPAAAKKVGDYKKAVSEEQARAGRCPKQAVPFFVDKLRNLASLVEEQLKVEGLSAIRTTVGDCVSPNPFSAAAAGARLKTYLRQLDEDAGETIHSFRAGAAITLAMSGVELEGVMAHVGWKGRATASHYMQLGKVLRHNSPASVLAKAADEGTAGAVANQYRAWDNTEGFLPVAKTL
ncbi:Hypp2818 [Branchiostoma lanceolatum]|uniref:Hypp2818 protein n=1 Tax=Branchiostoma lanceolatum TaxID=7740 RepID=A0A8J9ZXG9_BRALA|nr:Hypp2818 [Branchiostoma lanceolatum]